MLVGFQFDWFMVYCLGLAWALALSRRKGAPALVQWWPWVVGVAYFGFWSMTVAGMMQGLDAPPPVFGEVQQAPPGAALIENARMGTRLSVVAGLVWLVILTVQTLSAGGSDAGDGAEGTGA